MSFSEKSMNVWEIPFGAITICPVGGIMPLNENYKIVNDAVNGEIPLKDFTEDITARFSNISWRNDYIPQPDALFTAIATEEGFCWTFNMMNFDDLFEKNVYELSMLRSSDRDKHFTFISAFLKASRSSTTKPKYQ